MEAWEVACLVMYCCVVALLALYGSHRYQMLHLYFRNHHKPISPKGMFSTPPRVTVQLPLYNESEVVERLLRAVAALDYPRNRLQIQVLDDSDDETRDRARAVVDDLAAQGFDIQYIARTLRVGFKAGALANGLSHASGEFVLILDADFVPPPEVLRHSINYFTDPAIGMLQMRWGHLNRGYSLLTRLQSIFLDGHLIIEHLARNRSGRFFNFNGTAGIWRKRAIEEAGGWQHDTLTEDLDLSYRAQLAGWKFIYLPKVVVPAEIPVEMNAFKLQQHRWTKGAAQTAKKILPKMWGSRFPLAVKIEATFHLTSNISYILMFLVALLTLPVLHIRSQLGWEKLLVVDVPLFSLATMAVSGFYIASQRALYPDWKQQIKYLPILLALGMSLCINNTRAVLEGLVGHQSGFRRTPKYGVTDRCERRTKKWRYSTQNNLLVLLELIMAMYFAVILYYALAVDLYLGIPFFVLFHLGFLYGSVLATVQTHIRSKWVHLRPDGLR